MKKNTYHLHTITDNITRDINLQLAKEVLYFLRKKAKDINPYDVGKVVNFIDLRDHYDDYLAGFDIDNNKVRDFLEDCIKINDFSSIYNYVEHYNPTSKKLLLCIMTYINYKQQ